MTQSVPAYCTTLISRYCLYWFFYSGSCYCCCVLPFVLRKKFAPTTSLVVSRGLLPYAMAAAKENWGKSTRLAVQQHGKAVTQQYIPVVVLLQECLVYQ